MPAADPHESAIDQVIANPGISLSFNQTHNGPLNSPDSVLKDCIRPPASKILHLSHSRQGLWSSLTGTGIE